MSQRRQRLRMYLAAVATAMTVTAVSPIQPVAAAAIQQTVVDTGAVWSYLDDGTDPGPSWTDAGFDDAGWQAGNGQLGYGDGDETTVVSHGPDPDNKYATTYFRKTVSMADVHQLVAAEAALTYDDGAAIYLNGTRVLKTANLPDGYGSTTWATTDAEETVTLAIDPTLFVEGDNTIAVEIHQVWRKSSDISFDLGLTVDRDDLSPPPALFDDNASTDQGLAVAGDVSLNDDPGLVYSTTAVVDPAVGTFSLDPDGAWALVPAGGFLGTITVAHAGCDGAAVCGDAVLSIVVDVVGEVTVASIVADGAVWAYLDDGTDPGPSWTAAGFDDAGWQAGNGQLGYGDGDETTVVSYGPDPINKYATTYFRKTFSVAGAYQFIAVDAALTYDDAAVIYLNGVAIHNTGNLPAGFGHTSWATSNAEQTVAVPIDPVLFLEGDNTIAVEIHQAWRKSNDISFDLSVTATRHALPGPPAPTAIDDLVTTSAGVAVAGDVAANDRANDGNPVTWSVAAQDLPDPTGEGTLLFNADGSFQFTPATGYAGTLTLAYAACNGPACSGATVTIAVIDDPPPPLPPGGVPGEHPAIDPTALDVRPRPGQHGVLGFNPADSTAADVRVWDMQQLGDFMYVGGEFQQVQQGENGPIVNRAFLARFDVDTGAYDPTFTPTLDGNVHALEVAPRGVLLVGGEFTNIDGIANTSGLAAIDPITGQVDTGFRASVERPWSSNNPIVREIEVVGDLLYVAGNFSHLRDRVTNQRLRVFKAARVGADFGELDETWLPEVTGGSVYGLGVDQDRGRVMMSGSFTAVGGIGGTARVAVVDSVIGDVIAHTMPATAWTVFDIEYANDLIFLANGWNNQITVHAADDFSLVHQYQSDGDFQFIEKIGNHIFAGCHCTQDPLYPTARVLDATTGLVVPIGFDIGGNIEGAWAVATDDRGCAWIGGDIWDGGFAAGTVWARGFARFCPNP